MIDIAIQVEHRGAQMAITYHAETNETSTDAEVVAADKIVAAVTQYIADQGGSGNFVAR